MPHHRTVILGSVRPSVCLCLFHARSSKTDKRCLLKPHIITKNTNRKSHAENRIHWSLVSVVVRIRSFLGLYLLATAFDRSKACEWPTSVYRAFCCAAVKARIPRRRHRLRLARHAYTSLRPTCAISSRESSRVSDVRMMMTMCRFVERVINRTYRRVGRVGVGVVECGL